MSTDTSTVDIPTRVCLEMEIVRDTGATNMHSISNVRTIAKTLELTALTDWFTNIENTNSHSLTGAYTELLHTFPDRVEHTNIQFTTEPVTIIELFKHLGVSDDLIIGDAGTDGLISKLNETNTDTANADTTLLALSQFLDTVIDASTIPETEKHVHRDLAELLRNQPQAAYNRAMTEAQHTTTTLD